MEMSGAQSGPTGLIHLTARLYDPATGRFVREDTVAKPANPRSPNGYAYAADDPATAKDGNGLDYVDGPHLTAGSCGTSWRTWEVACWSATS